MKKSIFVVCGIICLMFLTGIVYADEKLDAKVELIYENFTQKVKLDKAEILLKEKIGRNFFNFINSCCNPLYAKKC